MESGSLVKALYEFKSDIKGELSFKANDVIQITSVIDRYWLSGTKGCENGNFPRSFVTEISHDSLPKSSNGEELFVASERFDAGQAGDLMFDRGDIIIGISPIDANWWHGKDSFGNTGIFPITYAWKVNTSHFREETQKKCSNLFAVAKMNMKAQLEEEIDLQKGDVIKIIEIIDKDWCRGECNSQVGIFPSAFVEMSKSDESNDESDAFEQIRRSSVTNYDAISETQICESKNIDCRPPSIILIKDKEESQIDLKSSANDEQNSTAKVGYDENNSGITPYGRALFNFNAQFSDELSFTSGEIIILHRYVDSQWMEGEIEGKYGLVPCDYIDVIVDCPGGSQFLCDNILDDNADDAIYTNLPDGSMACVLYDFYAQTDEDLTLLKGESITLLRQVNNEWYQAKNSGGRIGLCPKNYVEISPIRNSDELSIPESIHAKSSPSSPDLHVTNELDESINLYLQNMKSSINATSNLSTSSKNQQRPSSLPADSRINHKSDVLHIPNESEVKHDMIPPDNSKPYEKYVHNNEPNQSSNKHIIYDHHPAPVYHVLADIQTLQKTTRDTNITKTPQRPAPPVPLNDHSSHHPSIKTNTSFSVDDSENELKSKISNLENEIKKTLLLKKQLKDELNAKIESSGNDEIDFPKDLTEKLKACKDKLSSMKKHLKKLRSQFKSSANRQLQMIDSASLQADKVSGMKKEEDKIISAEMREKNAITRRKVLVELFETERNYLATLKLCYDTFLRNREETQNVGIDIETLFGNMDEVMDVASRLLEQLENAVNNRAEEKQVIGVCFDAIAEDMKQAYGHYCRNHDEVTALLEKYDENPAIQAYINKGIQKVRLTINCFDLGSILIKPVQRILKYPLLLNELHRCTEEGHPDKIELLDAIHLMTDVATAINEYKRRRDLVFKYRKDSQISFSAKLSKLNLHSLKKKSARMGMRLSSTMGIFSVTKDENFNEYEHRFKNLEKTARILLKDIHFFSDQMQECLLMQLSLAESICDYYVEKINLKEIQEYREVQRSITNRYWEDFKSTLDKYVFIPLNQLLKMFTGPNNLIQKRNDKLLDYDNSNSKIDKCKDLNKQKLLKEEQSIAKNNYKALNTQLLDELPTLISLSSDLIKSCLSSFIVARKKIIGRIARKIFPLMQLPLLISSQGDIIQNFTIKHNVVIDKVNDIELAFAKPLQATFMTLPRVNKEKSPRISNRDPGKRKSLSSSVNKSQKQSPNQKVYLSSKYPNCNLYSLKESYTASDILDISADAATIVGVIQKKDPMGSESRWFVDTGTIKGFIPSYVLQPHSAINTQLPPSYEDVMSSQNGATTVDTPLMNLSPPETRLHRIVSYNASAINDFDPLSSPQTQQVSTHSNSTLQDPFSPTSTERSIQNTLMAGNISTPVSRNIIPASIGTHRPQQSNSMISLESKKQLQKTLPVHSGIEKQQQNTSLSQFNFNSQSSSTCQTVDNHYANFPETQSAPISEENPSQSLLPSTKLYANINSSTGDRYDIPSEVASAMYDSASSENRYEEIPDVSNRYEEIEEPNRYEYIKEKESSELEYYYALYSFKSTGENMLTLAQGQVVLIHHKQDTEGNADWWYVEDRYGNQGYTPASYLTPHDNQC
ncbi:Dynamin-binding protein [Nymphon striatum]|nr:Dynamin-binding protein [Nymphon striatum]